MNRFSQPFLSLCAWGLGMAFLGAVDVALQYLCGGSASRHGIGAVLFLSVARGGLWAMFLLGMGCVICSRSVIASLALFIFPAVLVLVEAVARLVFNMGVGGEWFTLVVSSSFTEMFEFIGSLPMVIWLGVLLILISVAYLSNWLCS